ncbi:hypothetical protein MHHB_P0492 [Methanofervidicoccus abyssi]|uniref:Diadenylate cyclase n=2 Tax=Methanofervidicoccus abyssi TaxID=2082189 RepID=A0A401HPX6_9EURY|nr:hypothetical protein MHHB_P0492 [Methanofervidicoccus abyssi]
MKSKYGGSMDKIESIVKHGFSLAREIGDVLLVFTETGRTYKVLKKYLNKECGKNEGKNLKVVVTTPNEDTYSYLKNEKEIIPILLKYRNKYKSAMIKQAMIKLFENSLVKERDTVVAILGTPRASGNIDTISLIEVSSNDFLLRFYRFINSLESIKRLVVSEVLDIAMELSIEGKEGKPVGAMFVVGDSEKVLKMSSQLILNPFKGHDAIIFDKRVRGTIKELAGIDGAFIIGDRGEVISAGRYLEPLSCTLNLPLGLGARHYTAAAISKHTEAVAITVSDSGGIVRIFKDGEMVVEIDPNRLDRECFIPCI